MKSTTNAAPANLADPTPGRNDERHHSRGHPVAAAPVFVAGRLSGVGSRTRRGEVAGDHQPRRALAPV